MGRRLLVVGMIIVMFFAVGMGTFMLSYYYAPWWRVEVQTAVSGATLKVSSWKLAWVLDQLGYWDKGLWRQEPISKERGYKIPEKVVMSVDGRAMGTDSRAIDPKFPAVRYGIEAEMREGIYHVSIGLPDGIQDVPEKMLNERIILNLYSISRQGETIPYQIYKQKYQEATDWWPQWMKKLVRVYAK
jgi:hypothetical protein